MHLAQPWYLLLALLLPLLWWGLRGSLHPMSPGRRLWSTVARALTVICTLIALGGPRAIHDESARLVVAVVDRSASLGPGGVERTAAAADALIAAIGDAAPVAVVDFAQRPRVVGIDADGHRAWRPDGEDGTDIAAALRLARGLAPPDAAAHLVLIGDGHETDGDAVAVATELAAAGTRIDVLPISGDAAADAWVEQVRCDRMRVHEGAAVGIEALVAATAAGPVRVRLIENGIVVDERKVTLGASASERVRFERHPDQRGIIGYRVRIDGYPNDTVPANDEGLALVEVAGRPLVLLATGNPDEARHLQEAALREGLAVVRRTPKALPNDLQDLLAYDGVILHDVPANELGEGRMRLLHDYVEQLGGGLLMIGGERSFALGGYHQTPIDDLLPVHMQPRDIEERKPTALMLVLDRSGSMDGHKLELCKAAAMASADLLTEQDWIGVVAFDSEAHWIVPIQRAGPGVSAMIAGLNSGGGTNIQPGMEQGWAALRQVEAGARHMIVLTDGHTGGGGYEQLAAAMAGEGITISTVAVGDDADSRLLDAIARAGGGTCYLNAAPEQLRAIFTQDTIRHLGRSIREEPFVPVLAEEHPMLEGWPSEVPPLLGYVRTEPRLTAQVPLVTDLGEPLLAHWRVGLGKVTAFTSGADSRWAPLWIAGWGGFDRFWSQVLRDTVRRGGEHRLQVETERVDGQLRVSCVVLDDQASFVQDADLSIDVGMVDLHGLGRAMGVPEHLDVDQTGPGRYEGRLPLAEAGIYLVRVRHAGAHANAAYVHVPKAEHAVGAVDGDRLAAIAQAGGGAIVDGPASVRLIEPATVERSLDLRPLFLLLALACFCIDLTIRRWDNVLGIVEALRLRRA